MIINEAILQQIQKRTIVRLYKVGLSDGSWNGKERKGKEKMVVPSTSIL